MKIRPATAADQNVIRTIILRACLNPGGLDWRRFLIVEDKGQVIGIGQIKPHRDGSRELASLAVVPAAQGRGVGSLLVTTLLAGESGPVYLMCRAELAHYYARFGFAALTPVAMPPYFRRIARLMNLFASEPRLAIMRREGSSL